MNDKRYRYILYTIIMVIVATIAIQVYWNYKNYNTNKQQLINDVQTSLDKAVDDYYANLAKKTTLGFSINSVWNDSILDEGSELSKLLKDIDIKNNQFKALDCVDVSKIKSARVFRGLEAMAMMDNSNNSKKNYKLESADTLKFSATDISFSDVESLTSKVLISIKNDSFNLKSIDSLLKIDLLRKNISTDYELTYKTKQNLNNTEFKIGSVNFIPYNKDSVKTKQPWVLSTQAKSSFLPKGNELEINFTNQTAIVLQRILGGISISTLLVLAVISCLFYLLKIIKHQKQLAEVKNDLISNITHEFKTPIATISVALESITNFNSIDDKDKTKKYVDMSSNQLSKLNIMVEKLLETATLDSDSLELKKEDANLIHMLTTLCNRHQIHNPNKTITTHFKAEEFIAKVDVFHFENALNNILDNAIKYGGDIIDIFLIPKVDNFEISISDNGTSITKAHKERIFEKFYRIPKGNTHDVKGFGIGLYYTKTIIDKHNGSISLDLNNSQTTFKINMPNV